MECWVSGLNQHTTNMPKQQCFRKFKSFTLRHNKGYIMETQVRKVLEKEIKNLGCNTEITDNTNLTSDCGFDSLDFVEIMLHIEQKFNIRIPDEETTNMKTFGDAVKIIMKYVK